MAGVNYEVNIQLNAKTLDKQLGDLEKRVNNLKKNLAAPLRTEERAAKQAAASAKERARLEDRAAAAQVTRVNLGQRLNRLEEKGLDVTKGRTIINRSLKAYEEGRIQTARAQNSLARTYITQLERQLKVGVKTGRMQAENIDALSKAQVKRYTLDQQIRRLEEAGLNTDKLRAKLGEVTTAQARRQFGSFKQLTNELSLAIRKERDRLELQKRQTREIERQARIGGPRSPIGGRANIPGSPAALAARGETRSQRLQGVALGAGFPLLFGGGPGAILGGAAGGLVGGPAGFAAQIALSALGQQLDKFATATFETAKAFTSTSGAFDLMNEKMLFSTDLAMEHAIALEEQGKATELAQFLANDMAKAIGNNGVQALKDLGDESKETTKQWNLLTIQLQRLIAGPLSGFLKILNQVLGQVTTGAAFKGFMQDISPEARATAQARLTELTGTEQQRRKMARTGRRIPGLISTTAAQQQIMREMAGERPDAPAFDVTGADLRSITAPKEKKPKKGRRSRLPDLVAEGTKLQELLTLEQRRSELMLNQDKMGLARLDYQRELLSFTQEEAKIRANDVPNEEKIQALKNVDYKRQIAGVELERELAQIQKDRNQNNMDALQKHIEAQYELNFAIQAQLQLAESIAETMGTGMAGAFDLLITGAENWSNSLRNIAATVLRDIARQLIQIYVIEQAIGFMKTLLQPFVYGETPLGAGGGKVGGKGTFGPNYGLPARANGGPVRGRHPYIVGERGPELFVPGHSGEIVPNHMIDLGGKFMPMHPLFLAAMAGVGNFGGRRQDFMNYMIGGRNFGHAAPRANGGPVSAGSQYLVGERGPEMFVPRGGGGGGGGVQVGAINITVQNSGEQLSPAAQKQIANQVQGIVMSTLVNERRSGGVLR